MPADTRAFRERHKLTQQRLAELLRLPNPAEGGKGTVARWETGTRTPPPYLDRALADVEREITGCS